MRATGHVARALIVLAAVTTAAACRPAATVVPERDVIQQTYAICPQFGEQPPEEITDRAIEILGARLEALGVGTSTITAGKCIDITAEVDDREEPAVREAMTATGNVQLMPIGAGLLGQVSVGGEPPTDVQPLLESADFTAAAVQPAEGAGLEPTLGIQASPAGAAALASWTRANDGEVVAIVVDRVIVALPSVTAPVEDGRLIVSLGSSPPVSLDAIAAMINSGPLPPEWAQPERPQG